MVAKRKGRKKIEVKPKKLEEIEVLEEVNKDPLNITFPKTIRKKIFKVVNGKSLMRKGKILEPGTEITLATLNGDQSEFDRLVEKGIIA
jgi:hypothetical protein